MNQGKMVKMKNYRFLLVFISILTILYSCKKNDSNPVQSNYHQSVSPTIEYLSIDSNYIKNLTVDLFYEDSLIINFELRDSNFYSINFLVEELSENSGDCGGWAPDWKLIESVTTKTRKVKFKSCYGCNIPTGINIFKTSYAIDYQKEQTSYDISKKIAMMTIDLRWD